MIWCFYNHLLSRQKILPPVRRERVWSLLASSKQGPVSEHEIIVSFSIIKPTKSWKTSQLNCMFILDNRDKVGFIINILLLKICIVEAKPKKKPKQNFAFCPVEVCSWWFHPDIEVVVTLDYTASNKDLGARAKGNLKRQNEKFYLDLPAKHDKVLFSLRKSCQKVGQNQTSSYSIWYSSSKLMTLTKLAWVLETSSRTKKRFCNCTVPYRQIKDIWKCQKKKM